MTKIFMCVGKDDDDCDIEQNVPNYKASWLRNKANKQA